jgi:beta-hydroxylase
LDPARRKRLLKSARKVLRQVHRGIGRASLIGDRPFFSSADFPWATELEQHWPAIRAELDEVLEHRDDLPDFKDISPDQKHLAPPNQWKTFFFFAYGVKSRANAERCPRTAELLSRIPGARTAFFSILAPRVHIPAHRGPYKGVVRCHLGLLIPEPREHCRIRVADEIAHWEEGKCLFFDDTYEHEVWNDTDGMRVALFLDVLRPLRFPLSALNRAVIRAIAASPFITDAQKNHEAWERLMADVWR